MTISMQRLFRVRSAIKRMQFIISLGLFYFVDWYNFLFLEGLEAIACILVCVILLVFSLTYRTLLIFSLEYTPTHTHTQKTDRMHVLITSNQQ